MSGECPAFRPVVDDASRPHTGAVDSDIRGEPSVLAVASSSRYIAFRAVPVYQLQELGRLQTVKIYQGHEGGFLGRASRQPFAAQQRRRGPIVAGVTSRGEVMELVCGAFGRTPPLSARLGTDRFWVATQRDSWRLERDWKDRKKDRTSVHVSDGITTWLPTYWGAFHAQRAHPDSFPARNLLDPSWLAGYDWDPARPGTHNGRDVLVMHACVAAAPTPGPADNRDVPTVTRLRPPAEVDVVIDAEYGFLHRMTGLTDSQPLVVEELVDVVVDPPLDESVFCIDPSRFQVIDDKYQQVLTRAFSIATEHDPKCRPIHMLAALSETDGQIGESLRPGGGPLLPRPPGVPEARSGGASYLCMQTQEATTDFAASRGEDPSPAHLLLALIDQADAEAMSLLGRSGIDQDTIRRVALSELGAPTDLPAIAIPPPVPAGYMDRPILTEPELDSRAWKVLTWRQAHLPLDSLRTPRDWQRLRDLEDEQVRRLYRSLRLHQDQEVSLGTQHLMRVQHIAHGARSDLVPPLPPPKRIDAPTVATPIRTGDTRFRRRWRPSFLSFTIGWGTWFRDRWSGMKRRWEWLQTRRFAFRTRASYRGCPHPDPAEHG